MELGYAVIIPTFVFLDATLSPLERLLYGVLSMYSTRSGSCGATNEEIAKNLRYKTDGVLKQISEEALIDMLQNLEDHNYIHIETTEQGRSIVVVFQKQEIVVSVKAQPKDTSDLDIIAKEILKYLSDSCIVRGYRAVPYKETEANLTNIKARLSEGTPVRDFIAVINTKFQDPFFIENPKFLNPQTLFRPSKFDGYLTQTSSIKDVADKVVTKRGLAKTGKGIDTDVDGVSF